MSTTLHLSHLEPCSKSRNLDVTHHDDGLLTLHCVECSAHQAYRDGVALPSPAVVGPLAGFEEFRSTVTMEATR